MDQSVVDSIISTGKSLFEKKQYSKALDQFRSALDLFHQKNDPLMAAEMQNNISVCLQMTGHAQEALEAALGTDQLFATAGDKKRQAMALGNQASAYEDLKDFDKALQLFERSEALLQEVNEKEYRAIVLKRISNIQVKHGHQMEALASMNAALKAEPNPTVKEKKLKKVLEKFFSAIHPQK